jgi:DNA-binding CsgD family transcriptional regulator
MKALSGREVQIIRQTARGYTAKEIAKLIGLEPRTIEVYVGSIRKKLQAKNIAHAVFIASQHNILNELN